MPRPHYPDSAIAPARHMFAIVPHDVNEQPSVLKALRCDSATCVVVLQARDSSVDVTVNMVAGETLAVDAQFVRATGTSGDLHGLG